MAFDVSANPWSMGPGDVGQTIWSSQCEIHQIEFMGYAGDGDQCILTDVNGKVVWQGDGAADKQTVRSGKIGWTRGLKLATLTNGTVLVYVR